MVQLIVDSLCRTATGLLVVLIQAYRLVCSPLLGPCCRYDPSCSSYAIEALRHHGPLRGSWLALQRILRCHPFHPGGFDPVPMQGKRASTQHKPLSSGN